MACGGASPLTELGTEHSLVRACVDGDDAAWRQLHLRYYPIAVAFLRKLGVRPTELEDATQEVFLEMHRYLGRFRGQSDLKTWVYRLCLTQARLAHRRRRLCRPDRPGLLRFRTRRPRALRLPAAWTWRGAASRRKPNSASPKGPEVTGSRPKWHCTKWRA
jgi:DNA-directed RNA polymerase specialized sigma24 family protein